MRPEPVTTALSGIAAALIFLAVALDTGELLVVASMILGFLAIHALTFFLQVRSLAASVTVTRIPEHQTLRQGGITPVALEIHAMMLPGMSATIRDLIPPGTRMVRGTGEITLHASSSDGIRAEYDLQAFSRGDLKFAGIVLAAGDRYFTDTVYLGRNVFRTPVMHIQPAPAFTGTVSHGDYGSLEVPQVRAIPGQGIHSFRRFQTGDDTRAIDWKLSAKHDTLILREYMGKVGGSPLFILDLPPVIGDTPAPWDGLAASLTTHIEQALRRFSRIDILVLSGGRIIHTLTLHRDPRPWYRMLSDLSPGEGYCALFRHPFPLILASRYRSAEKAAQRGGTDQPFFSRLAAVTGGFRTAASPTVFERQLVAAFSGNREREIFIFSLFQGDLSHIREAIHRAWEGRMPVHLRVPSRSATPALMHELLHAGATTVEVLP